MVTIDYPGKVRLPGQPGASCSGQSIRCKAEKSQRREDKENFIIQSTGPSKSSKLGFRVILLFFHLFHQVTRETALCGTNE